VRSQIADDIFTGERMGAASAAMATVPETGGLEVAGGGCGSGDGCCEVAVAAPVEAATVVGRPKELMKPEQSDTKLVETTVLPGLGRRL
jgi:hypothetical protein